MKNCNTKARGLLVLRLLIGGIFLYHGIGKIPMAEQAAGFIGGAVHAIGLTFLSVNAWFWIITIAEITAGGLFVLGLFPRVASVIVMIVMLGAINLKGWSFEKAEMDIILGVMALGLFLVGPGQYALQGLLFKGCCGDMCAPTAAPAKKPVKK